jgi:hypothetical protein
MNHKTQIDKDTCGILSELIEKTISSLTINSSIVKETKKLVGKKYIKEYFENIRYILLKEIRLDDQNIENNYVSLKTILPVFKVETTRIGDMDVYLYKEINRKNASGKYLINIVFPCRNSARIISNSIELLISEIRKAHQIDFNIIFQVNNTSDNTIGKITKSLEHYSNLTKAVNFYLVETDPKLQISLPGSLNLGVYFAKELNKKLLNQYKEIFFSFWDDELINLIPTPDSLFNSNLNELLSAETNKAISGYMIDNRINVTRWHEISKGFSSDIRFVHSKPYLHGGSGTVMRLKDYPKEGIELGGIADTDLSASLLKKIDYKTLRKLNYKEWPVRSNPLAPVFHPIEDDILKWTIKYLMYQISWENTYKTLNESKNKIGKLWKGRIDENRRDFHRRINDYLINLSPEKILDREFMHYYYLTVQNIKEKKAFYENLKSYRKRSLEIK